MSHKKRDGTSYIELVYWHPVRSGGHVVHCSASRVRNVDTIFHTRVGLVCVPQKCSGTCYIELVFVYLMRSVGHIVRSNPSRV
jgi:hypothetical protein